MKNATCFLKLNVLNVKKTEVTVVATTNFSVKASGEHRRVSTTCNFHDKKSEILSGLLDVYQNRRTNVTICVRDGLTNPPWMEGLIRPRSMGAVGCDFTRAKAFHHWAVAPTPVFFKEPGGAAISWHPLQNDKQRLAVAATNGQCGTETSAEKNV